ncbi:MAG: hypothetical protein GY953_45385 [bacterium]|nr:hypothetical protein [bacterium]
MGFALLCMGDAPAFAFSLVIIGLVLFFPSSSDPLRIVPPERLALWPLANREYRLLRMLSPWLNPLTWLVAILLVWKRVSIGLWALIAVLFGLGFLAPSLLPGSRGNVWRRLPDLPGPLNQLVRKNLREMLSTLDFYGGLILAAPALYFRARGVLPVEALFPLTLVVVLTISTYAQSLFGLDGEGGRTRYRLLPIAGWRILAAKDVTFLSAALLLTLLLSPLGGLAMALMALATGHHASVTRPHQQTRWRFQTAASFGGSLAQIIPMILAGAGVVYASPLILAPCVAAYAGSTWWFGRVLERQAL